MIRPTVLLADNDQEYRSSLIPLLRLEDYEVKEADSVESAMGKLDTVPLSLALVDLRLMRDDTDSDISGLQVAKKARERGIPCIIITAFDSVETTRLALRQRGEEPSLAVDYVPKRLGPDALLASVAAVLERRKGPAGSHELMIDAERGVVSLRGVEVRMSRQQFALLSYLDRKRGTVCSRKELMEAVYDEDMTEGEANTDKRLERLIWRVREKIEDDPRSPKRLVSIPGLGLRLESGE